MKRSTLERTIPLPPLRYRYLVGPMDSDAYENPQGDWILPEIPAENYESVFDFGCGCGRVARKLLLQKTRPKRYLGIDINKRMIQWCQANLCPFDSNFQFVHHDVHNPLLGATNSNRSFESFPAESNSFSLFMAFSVFTHLMPAQTEQYLSEVARILKPGGLAYISWFLFDKSQFKMMQSFQNALFINATDPTNAVIYDEEYVRVLAKSRGLEIIDKQDRYQICLIFKKVGEASADAVAQYREVPATAVQGHRQTTGQGATTTQALPSSDANPEGIRGELVSQSPEFLDSPLFGGEFVPCVFHVRNTGDCNWVVSPAAGSGVIQAKVEWLISGSASKVVKEVISPLPGEPLLETGRTLLVPLVLTVPRLPGRYRVKLSLIRKGEGIPGVTAIEQEIRIEGSARTAFSWIKSTIKKAIPGLQ